jgi:hypothetical protein
MSAADEAARYADSVLALIPQLAHMAAEERRTHACWYELYAKKRLATCRRIMRPWWRSRVRKHEAACSANEAMHQQCTAAVRTLATSGIA